MGSGTLPPHPRLLATAGLHAEAEQVVQRRAERGVKGNDFHTPPSLWKNVPVHCTRERRLNPKD